MLGTACERKNVEAVRILVQYKADTNHRCNRGWTALHESVARNDLEVMEILVSGGAKVEAKNAYGITPLFVAAQSGQLEASCKDAFHVSRGQVHSALKEQQRALVPIWRSSNMGSQPTHFATP